jgi:hypothetical protein
LPESVDAATLLIDLSTSALQNFGRILAGHRGSCAVIALCSNLITDALKRWTAAFLFPRV